MSNILKKIDKYLLKRGMLLESSDAFKSQIDKLSEDVNSYGNKLNDTLGRIMPNDSSGKTISIDKEKAEISVYYKYFAGNQIQKNKLITGSGYETTSVSGLSVGW